MSWVDIQKQVNVGHSDGLHAWPESILNGTLMAERIYRHDWSKTPVGPIETWPQNLRIVLNVILANSFPMMIHWGPDYIQFYNDGFIPIAGHNHPDMLGIPCRETWSEIWDSIVDPIFSSVCNEQQSILIERQHFPVLRFGYLEEVYCLSAYSPLRDDNGAVGGLLMNITEITPQVLGERRMQTLRDLGARASEARTPEEACAIAGKVFEQSAPDLPFAMVYLLDESGRVAHRTTVAGIAENETASPLEIELNTELECWPLSEAMTSGIVEVSDLQERFGQLPGGPWPEAPRTAVILCLSSQTAGQPVGFFIAGISPRRALDEKYREFLSLVSAQVATSIANAQVYEQERKRAEALAELDRAKTTFFSNISHEFRTPLTLILGPLEELLSHREQLSQADRDHLDIIYRNGLRLLRLVNSLLDFSRLEAGRVEACYQATDMVRYTAELASVFRSAVEKSGLTYTVDCVERPEDFDAEFHNQDVYIDRQMWEKIVLNLLSNAFKFTFNGGITLQQWIEGQYLVLRVRDTGIGIAPDQLDKVFDRFHRVKDSRSRTHEGTGIGLSLVKELVQLHGGSISIESTLGEGTEFRITLPLGAGHLPPELVSKDLTPLGMPVSNSAFVEEALQWFPQAEQEASPLKIQPQEPFQETARLSLAEKVPKARIILVDDNNDMLIYVKRLLTPLYEVVAVPNGQLALDAIQQHRQDLVLTDIMMPVMDGVELLRRIRQNAKTKTLPVIMLSARAGEESSIEGLESGANDYLVKPFSARELLARVHSNLEISRIREEAQATLFQAQKMQVIGQLAGGVAHDFNTLLTVLIGNLQLLERHLDGDDPVAKRKLASCFTASERITNLTRQLLAFARKQPLASETIDLNKLIHDMDELFSQTLGGMILVKKSLAEDLHPASGDPQQMELAILNLAINARDAMAKGGTLTIETRNVEITENHGIAPPVDLEELVPGPYISLTVTDTGIGMEPEILTKVFEPFFTTKDVGKGTGLGLSQVYGLVKQLGGTVQIQSTPGQGTRVEMLLPSEQKNFVH